MNISLDYIVGSPNSFTFQIAFHSSSQRFLLPYPDVTGLKFNDEAGNQVAEWRTRLLTTEPLDDFVLTPRSKITFDLHANINNVADEFEQWGITLHPGRYSVHYIYHVARDTEWYDFLQKRSRFVHITPLWQGTMRSNSIIFDLPQ